VLQELRVENLLLLERAELRFSPGLNVLTGETGAGKTLLAHALDLLLGGRARSGIVRGGASEAYVEGVFARLPGVEAGLEERIPDDADELVLARRLWPDGRTRAYICGRSANLADLRELGSRLLAFYGQHEHRKLTLAAAQLDVLDGYCGPGQLQARARAGATYERVSSLRRRVAELGELARARDRELDLIAFELDEIEAAQPTEEEQEALSAERDRLRHLDALQKATAAGAEALASDGGDDDDGGAAGALVRAVVQLESAAGIDPRLAPLLERLQAVRYEAEDLSSELRRYALGLEGAPGRLEEVEERLALFARLERKHGGSIAEVLGHAERCRARRDELEHADVALEAAQAELAAAQGELDRLVAESSARRRQAAAALAAAVRERLAELAMAGAQFVVDLREREDGCGPRGADTVELRIAPNLGMPAGPLREIASGGELSRVMLALLSVAHAASGKDVGACAGPLLVFDEIDAGIGGHTARAVGDHLRQLAERSQILCITHLPQVAALAASHFTIVKDTSALPARTTVTALAGDEVVRELVRMLGAGEGDAAASEHARQLLEAA
jgi:DNA repair protein RecN (Recombination protein N)